MIDKPKTPSAMVLVPVDPTDAMRQAIYDLLSAHDDGSDISPSFFMKMLINAAPAEQTPAVGGEPVYQVCNGVDGWIDVDRLRYTACSLDPEEWEVRVLYRAQPPAKVVLPERRTPDGWLTLTSQDLGWNACLDEIAKLNPAQES